MPDALNPRVVRDLTLSQQLRKLQLAVDHIAAVMEVTDSGAIPELSEALDAIHSAESVIEDAREDDAS